MQGPASTESKTPATHRSSLRRAAPDLLIAALLTLIALSAAMDYLRTEARRSPYLLNYYAPAVMLGLGHGFQNPQPGQAPAIEAFLALERDHIAPGDVPTDLQVTKLTQFQRRHRYAMYAMGWCWRIGGLSWAALDPLHALLFAATCLCAYGLLRLCAGRVIAGVLALCIVFSPLMLYVLPQFRDFSKAPFLLSTLLLLGVAVRFPLPPRRLHALAAVLGLILGVGLGFRRDILICIPPSLLVLLCFVPGPIRKTWPRRAIAATVTVIVFAITGGPIHYATRDGANSGHGVALGLTENHNTLLGVGGAPYKVGHLYRDAYMHTRISSHAMHRHGQQTGAPYGSNEYGTITRAFLLDVYAMFPADFLTRWYAAVARVLNHSPFTLFGEYGSLYHTPEDVSHLLDLRWQWLGWLAGTGAACAAIALLTIASLNLRWALAATFFILYFAGYSSLQFQPRHYFHLEILFFCIVAFWLNALIWTVTHLRKRREIRARWPVAARRIAAFTAIITALLGGSYAAAHVCQHLRVGQLYETYANAPRTSLSVRAQSGRRLALTPEGFLSRTDVTERHRQNQVHDGMLVVETDPAPFPLFLEFRYTADSPTNDFSGWIAVPPASDTSQGPTTVYFPAYNTTAPYLDSGQRRFDSIVMYPECMKYIRGVYALDDLGALPLMLTLQLPSDHATAPRRLAFLEHAEPREARARAAYNRNLFVNGSLEQWDEASGLPTATMPPAAHTRIERERERVWDGDSAVRQTWLSPTPQPNPAGRFGIYNETVTPNTTYEIFLRALNTARTDAFFEVYQATKDAQGRPAFTPLTSAPIAVPPSTGFREYAAEIFVPPRNGPVALIVFTGAAPRTAPKTPVIWDAFRLVAVPAATPR